MPERNQSDKTETHTILVHGTAVAQYRIIEPIGSGGMGEVYLAEDTTLDRRVALKFMPHNLARVDQARARFVREAKAVARLHHPNIVTIFEVSEFGGRPYFAMEYVGGTSLAEVIRGQSLSLDRIQEIATKLCEGLREAHKKGVIHRDIKPANVVVTAEGQVKLLDFGLAALAGEESLTRPGTTLGTLAYMSPEQVRGQIADEKSDLFSLGITLYELIAGKSPFKRENDAATLQAILEFQPERPEFNGHRIPDTLAIVTEQLLQKDPARRPQTVDEILPLLTTSQVVSPVSSGASIAVLPFANMSDDATQEFFCDGIAEDIINDLSQVPELRVVARTSAFSFKGKNEDIREIGRRLNVATVLEGSVRKAGSRLRITAQLINVADGYHLWSERYDRELSDIFAIQEDIARAVVEKLKGYLLPASAKPRRATEDIDAYEMSAQGRYFLRMRTKEGFEQALACFRQATRLRPSYVLGYAGLADTHFLLYAYDMAEPKDAIARARSAVLRAMEIDDSYAEIHATLGGILTFYDWSWREAEQAFRRALELNPGYATAHQWYGELLTFMGQYDQAEEQFGYAKELDPLSEIVMIMHGALLYRSSRRELAIQELRRAIDQGTRNDTAFVWLGFLLLEAGRRELAFEQFRLAREYAEDSSFTVSMHAYAYTLTGDNAGAELLLRNLYERRSKEYISPALLAIVHLALGQLEQGHALLREAIRIHASELIFFSIMPYYERIRGDATTQTLLSVLGLRA